MELRWRRASRIAPLLAVGLGAGLLAWALSEPPARYRPGPPAPARIEGDAVLSLLAVGDTGEILPLRPFAEGQRSVARGMSLEDLREPVDALVLLGDNFHPDGLRQEELVERVARNLVRPFCRFADLRGPRSAEVADACRLPGARRHPVPIFAVLGNHDYDSPESPELQRGEIPRFLPNWRLPDSVAHPVELKGGLSLVLVDSMQVGSQRSAAPVREALRRARGPWRVLAMHHPMALREGQRPEPESYRMRMRRAVEEAGVPLQLVLSGHRHNLQLMTMSLPEPALHVIAGGGASRKPFREPPFANRHFGIETTGFARVDLVGREDSQGLVVSIYTMPRYPIQFWAKPRLVSRWWVERSGAAYQVFPPPKSPASTSSSPSTR